MANGNTQPQWDEGSFQALPQPAAPPTADLSFQGRYNEATGRWEDVPGRVQPTPGQQPKWDEGSFKPLGQRQAAGAQPSDTGFVAGVERGAKALVSLPWEVTKAFAVPPQTPEETGVFAAGQGTGMGNVALAAKRLLFDPQYAEWRKAMEEQPMPGDDQWDNATERKHAHIIAALTPIVGPMAGNLADRYIAGDRSGALGELVSYGAGSFAGGTAAGAAPPEGVVPAAGAAARDFAVAHPELLVGAGKVVGGAAGGAAGAAAGAAFGGELHIPGVGGVLGFERGIKYGARAGGAVARWILDKVTPEGRPLPDAPAAQAEGLADLIREQYGGNIPESGAAIPADLYRQIGNADLDLTDRQIRGIGQDILGQQRTPATTARAQSVAKRLAVPPEAAAPPPPMATAPEGATPAPPKRTQPTLEEAAILPPAGRPEMAETYREAQAVRTAPEEPSEIRKTEEQTAATEAEQRRQAYEAMRQQPAAQAATPEVRIHDSSLIGSHHGQQDLTIYATTGPEQRVQGKLDYSVYGGEVHINHIEVAPDFQRQGVATQMWNKLKADNPGMKINPGYATEEGAAFLKSVEGVKPTTFKEALTQEEPAPAEPAAPTPPPSATHPAPAEEEEGRRAPGARPKPPSTVTEQLRRSLEETPTPPEAATRPSEAMPETAPPLPRDLNDALDDNALLQRLRQDMQHEASGVELEKERSRYMKELPSAGATKGMETTAARAAILEQEAPQWTQMSNWTERDTQRVLGGDYADPKALDGSRNIYVTQEQYQAALKRWKHKTGEE